MVSVLSGAGGVPTYRINADSFTRSQLRPELGRIFATRAEKVMFVRGGGDVFYGDVAAAIDDGHQAGVERIGILTTKVESGQ